MKKSIFILSVIFCVACQKVDDVHNKNADQLGTNEEVYPENLSDIGYYHNEILKNYISISKTPSLLSTNSESDDFIKLMADYGTSVCMAYKRNPPAGNIDKWVGNIINMSLSGRQYSILNNILNNDMSISAAVNNAYGKEVVPAIVQNYLDEIDRVVEQYAGTYSFDNQLKLLHLRYIRSTTDNNERQLFNYVYYVASGSYEYWDTQHSTWSPHLSGRFWKDLYNSGRYLLDSDISGAVDYILGTMIVGAIMTWKVCVAYAAASSVVAGVEVLLEDFRNKTKSVTVIPDNVTFGEVYDAYLIRKQELGL